MDDEEELPLLDQLRGVASRGIFARSDRVDFKLTLHGYEVEWPLKLACGPQRGRTIRNISCNTSAMDTAVAFASLEREIWLSVWTLCFVHVAPAQIVISVAQQRAVLMKFDSRLPRVPIEALLQHHHELNEPTELPWVRLLVMPTGVLQCVALIAQD